MLTPPLSKDAQILDLIFEFGDLFFEIQKDSHAECGPLLRII